MTCAAVEVWSHFLDLFIAFLLLSASSTPSSSLKSLAALGLRLRCPCDGLFGCPRRNGGCFLRDLSKRLVEKVTCVQVSVESIFPFASIMMKGNEGDYVGDGNGYAVSETDGSLGLQKFESAFGEVDQGDASFCGVDLDAAKYRQPAVKGKRVLNLRGRSVLGPHRKGFPQRGTSRDEQIAGAGANHKIGVTSPSCFSPRPDDLPRAIPLDVRAEEEGSRSTSFAKTIDCCCGMEKNKFKRVNWANVVGNSCQISKESVRESEVAAKAECAGCASLCLELKKERNAAASAADEAMAMIMRLQKEKASVEMESKQYRRMMEEKSAFNTEEMNILKEILVRREMEKHFLEKEVEAYSQIGFTNEQLGNSPVDYLSMQKLEIFSLKEDDVDKVWMAKSINGPLLKSSEPLSFSDNLRSQEVGEFTIPPKRLGVGNGDGILVDVFSDDMKDAHSDTLDISHNCSNLLIADSRIVHDVCIIGVVLG